MPLKKIKIDELHVNHANDRHGDLGTESDAISWLFRERTQHMKNLARDIVSQRGIFEAPLVAVVDNKYVIFDGNRRVSCLKLIANPSRAPTIDLEQFFQGLRSNWKQEFPEEIECQLETDLERVDEILFRRHTGAQAGVGQTTWDDRAKAIFVERTGKGSGPSIAELIEKYLTQEQRLPTQRKIPRSTLNRLLSAEKYRKRVGVAVHDGDLVVLGDKHETLNALSRIANDLATRKIVLGDLWDKARKTEYLDSLEADGVLPEGQRSFELVESPKVKTRNPSNKSVRLTERLNLIPHKDYGVEWHGSLERAHAIWQELQVKLLLDSTPNAIAVLFRVLLEISVENYRKTTDVALHDHDKLSRKIEKIADHLLADGKIDKKQLGALQKLSHHDSLISTDTLNRYVHSPNFSPSPMHLTAIWDGLSEFIVLCLNSRRI